MDRGGGAGYIRYRMNFELKSCALRRRFVQRVRRALPRLALPLGLAFAVLVTVLPPATPTSAQIPARDSAEIADSRDRVLADSRYQTARPEPEKPDETDLLRIPPWLVDTVLWTAGIIVGAIVLYFLVSLLIELLGGRSLLRLKRDTGAAGPAVIETPVALDRETRQRTLAEADALAAKGRYAEAIHLLLLVAMERLRRELGPRVAPALTSREVLALAPIPEAAVDPLSRMVALSEIKHFGGRAADAPDYRSCRRDFITFSGGEPAVA